MPSLQDLPAEIRREIFLIIVFPARTEPPKSPCESMDRRRIREDSGVWIQAKSPTNPALSLLLTNRRFHDELQDILASHSKHDRVTYDLDVMFVKSCGLWPTWTSLPVLAHHASRVVTSFRIFQKIRDIYHQPAVIQGYSESEAGLHDMELLAGFHGYSEFGHRFSDYDEFGQLRVRANDILPGAWNFYHIINAFLANGPLGLAGPSSFHMRFDSHSPCRYTIGDLVVNVITPPKLDPILREMLSPSGYLQNMMVNEDNYFVYGNGEDSVFQGPSNELGGYRWNGPTKIWDTSAPHPGDKLALYIANTLWHLLELNGCSAEYGKLLYRGILGGIEIRVDGDLRRRYDMQQLRKQYLT